eukprot:CAMPEP_0117572392 /NCGR_PEP_ID=MMETSP0784-20121206/60328_1 /TAXON_ID=39447 /ORGANISM="" /LENGTH=70 /DNA_ID=CAMNT_0005370751 /DNA_START=183 /DNA_END=392 /DNA_ORIENTATION=-
MSDVQSRRALHAEYEEAVAGQDSLNATTPAKSMAFMTTKPKHRAIWICRAYSTTRLRVSERSAAAMGDAL